VAAGNTDTGAGNREEQTCVNAPAPARRVLQCSDEEYDAEPYYRHTLKDTQRAWRQQQIVLRVQGISHHADASEKSGQIQLASTGYCHIKVA
jgi:hypothetical protein